MLTNAKENSADTHVSCARKGPLKNNLSGTLFSERNDVHTFTANRPESGSNPVIYRMPADCM